MDTGELNTSGMDFAVIGDPISHTLSPRMHTAGFRAQALSLGYGALHVRPAQLGEALAVCHARGMRGLNLTVPHKRAAVEHLVSLDPKAQAIGAVNTLLRSPLGWVGHNTDASGFVRALDSLGGAPARSAWIFGAGGAALAIAHGLRAADPAMRLLVVTRRPDLESPAWEGFERVGYAALLDPELRGPAAQLWVNATSVGMRGGPVSFPIELPLDGLAAGGRVVDVVYPRVPGGLLDRALARGARVQDGRAMLLWQGVVAQELWLGRSSLSAEAVQAMTAALD